MSTPKTPRRFTRALLAVGVALSLAFGAVAVSPATAGTLTITSIWKAIKKKADKRYFTKAKSDARYSKKPTMVRGTYSWTVEDGAGTRVGVSAIGFGMTLPAAPITHVIRLGDPLPAQCSGTVDMPSAAPGHLCVFEGLGVNAGSLSVLDSQNNVFASDRFGAVVFGYPAAAGYAASVGSWALGVGPTAAWAKTPAPAQKSGSGLLPK